MTDKESDSIMPGGGPDPVRPPTASGDEDERFEELLSPLRAPAHLADSVKLAVRRRAARPRRGRWFRAAAAAAVLLLGVAVGLFLPAGRYASEREAKAASLKCDIAAYDRGARFVDREARLLSAEHPDVSALVFLSHLELTGVADRGREILARLRDGDSGGLPVSELRSFFRDAVRKWDSMSALASDGRLTSDEIEKLRSTMPSLLPPPDLLAFAYPPVPPPEEVIPPEAKDRALRDYLRAKRFIFAGDYARAAVLLGGVLRSGNTRLFGPARFWRSRCTGGEICFRISPLGSGPPPAKGGFGIVMPGGARKGVSIRVSPSQPAYAVFEYADGSIGVCDEKGEFRRYRDMDELKRKAPDIYRSIAVPGAEERR